MNSFAHRQARSTQLPSWTWEATRNTLELVRGVSLLGRRHGTGPLFPYHHTAPTQGHCSSWQAEAETKMGIYPLPWESMGLVAKA